MTAIIYLLYLALATVFTVWTGRSLNRNGRVFLIENFSGNVALADSVNHLLLVGFYLVNFGFITIALKYGNNNVISVEDAIELLSTKIGWVILILGAMHFFNMRALIKFRHFKWNSENAYA